MAGSVSVVYMLLVRACLKGFGSVRRLLSLIMCGCRRRGGSTGSWAMASGGRRRTAQVWCGRRRLGTLEHLGIQVARRPGQQSHEAHGLWEIGRPRNGAALSRNSAPPWAECFMTKATSEVTV